MAAGHPWIARPGDRLSAAQVGGKAAGLERLVRLGLPVPRYAVLTADAYRACCPAGRVPAAEDARLRAALDEVWAELGTSGPALAVRSSAVEEDAVARSWAGQMETSLNVTTREALGTAVLGCWRSLHGARATAYRSAKGQGVGDDVDAAMAVVVQEMVAPAASGVVFTVDPVRGDPDRIVVSAVLGVGEGLVSGRLDADTWVLDRQGRTLEATVVPKTERIALAPGGGVASEPVGREQADAPALGEKLLRSLAQHAVRAEAAVGLPLDIEFAVAGERLFFLQARPVTTTARRPPVGEPNRLVWDNANIVESYPGITLPLTYSFIRRAYHAVYWQFCEVLGLKESEIRAHDHMLWNMLGLHQGRVYYNLRNWYRLVSVLPAFRHNRRFMEGMMGVTRPGGSATGDTVSRSGGTAAVVGTALRAVWLQVTLGRRVRRFHATFDRVYAEFAALPYETMEPPQILEQFRRVEQALLWSWKAPIINDFSVMVFYGLLKRLTVAWGVDPEGSLQNALVARQGGIESTAVGDLLQELAAAVAADADLGRAVAVAPIAEVFGLVSGHPRCGPLLEAYLQRFKDRCVAELKLESRTMEDDPTPLMAALQASVRQGGRAPLGGAPPGLAQQARATVRARLSPWRRGVYAVVLGQARQGIRNRENQRLARTRAFALVRRMMRGVGRCFAEAGLLERWDDVFYLEMDEIMGLCDGAATLADPRALVAVRREQYARFAAAPALPDRFVTTGIAAVSHRVSDTVTAEPTGAGALHGLAAYPGVVERRAVVMPELDPRASLDGAILVAHQTDPGWVILFPAIGGLIVERGSMLSHSAIVAREMGIPAVVGVRGATSQIGTGDVVRLDGARGTVQVIAPASERDAR